MPSPHRLFQPPPMLLQNIDSGFSTIREGSLFRENSAGKLGS